MATLVGPSSPVQPAVEKAQLPWSLLRGGGRGAHAKPALSRDGGPMRGTPGRPPPLWSGCTCDSPQRFPDEGTGGGGWGSTRAHPEAPTSTVPPPPNWPLAGGDQRWPPVGAEPGWRALSAPFVSHPPSATGSSAGRCRFAASHPRGPRLFRLQRPCRAAARDRRRGVRPGPSPPDTPAGAAASRPGHTNGKEHATVVGAGATAQAPRRRARRRVSVLWHL